MNTPQWGLKIIIWDTCVNKQTCIFFRLGEIAFTNISQRLFWPTISIWSRLPALGLWLFDVVLCVMFFYQNILMVPVLFSTFNDSLVKSVPHHPHDAALMMIHRPHYPLLCSNTLHVILPLLHLARPWLAVPAYAWCGYNWLKCKLVFTTQSNVWVNVCSV